MRIEPRFRPAEWMSKVSAKVFAKVFAKAFVKALVAAVWAAWATPGAMASAPTSPASESELRPAPRIARLQLAIEVPAPPRPIVAGVARLWIPIPQEREGQAVLSRRIESSESFRVVLDGQEATRGIEIALGRRTRFPVSVRGEWEVELAPLRRLAREDLARMAAWGLDPEPISRGAAPGAATLPERLVIPAAADAREWAAARGWNLWPEAGLDLRSARPARWGWIARPGDAWEPFAPTSVAGRASGAWSAIEETRANRVLFGQGDEADGAPRIEWADERDRVWERRLAVRWEVR